MDKKIPLLLSIFLIIIAIVITFNATFIILSERYKAQINSLASEYGFYADLLQVDDLVKENYPGELDGEDIKHGTVLGYLYGLGDKYAEFYTSEEYETFLKELSGTNVGIGVSVVYNSSDSTIEVLATVEGSPADGVIEPGDFITAVEGKKVSDEGYYGTIALIRGEENTDVNLTVTRDGKEINLTLTRKEVISESAYVIPLSDKTVGMIRITGFNTNTPEMLKKAIDEIIEDGAKSVIFDIRNNGGGDLNSIVGVLDLLLPEGPVAHVKFGNGEEENYTSDGNYYKFDKIAVLTNDNTASAAELFAAALKDYNSKGIISANVIGNKTYGKGVLQQYFQLTSGNVLKITSGKFYPPYSDNFDGIGVIPDVEVSLSENQLNTNFYKLKEGNDDQLAAALNYIKN